MPRALATILLAVVVAFATAACGGNGDGADDGRLRVVATVAPVGALAAEVGGEHIELRTLVGAGADPHSYEITSSDRRALADADVILRNGLGLDRFLDSALADDADKVVTVTEGVRLRVPGEDSHDHTEDDGHDHGDVDPHVWQDIDNAKVMVANIVDAFKEADPEHAAAYEANGTAYAERLDEVDAEIREIIDSISHENRKIVVNHDAFGYFAERYGLEVVGTVIPGLSTSAEPSAREIAELQETIRREGVKAIFAEEAIEPRVARRIAADTGVRIVDNLYGDSLGPEGSGAETVDGMLLTNAHKFAEALR